MGSSQGAQLNEDGVSFETAQAAFFDDDGLLLADPDHSAEEDRFLLLGRTPAGLLVVCHCYRDDDEIIRIISARHATARERRTYNERSGQ